MSSIDGPIDDRDRDPRIAVVCLQSMLTPGILATLMASPPESPDNRSRVNSPFMDREVRDYKLISICAQHRGHAESPQSREIGYRLHGPPPR